MAVVKLLFLLVEPFPSGDILSGEYFDDDDGDAKFSFLDTGIVGTLHRFHD